MYWSFVELNTRERLRFPIPTSKVSNGWSIFNFRNAVTIYCRGDSIERVWFTKLEQKLGGSICDVLKPIINAVYYGDWDYEPTEYKAFLLRNDSTPLSEKEFRETLDQIHSKWTRIELLIRATRALLHALERTEPLNSVHWDDHTVLISDVKGLLAAFELAKARGADRARINFDEGYLKST